MVRRLNLVFVGLLSLQMACPSLVRCADKWFVVDGSQSVLALSGTTSGFPVLPQGNGSLSTSYTGLLHANITESTVELTSGSTIQAGISGDWQPGPGGVAGSAPANYGGQVNAVIFVGRAALRHIVIELVSPVVPRTPGSFPADEIRFVFPEDSPAVVDYSIGTDVGAEFLAGTSTNGVLTEAAVDVQDGTMTLSIPVDYTFTVSGERPGEFQFVGQIVATEVIPPAIETFEVSPTDLNFTLTTVPGTTYRILGATHFGDFTAVLDHFTAEEPVTFRAIPRPAGARHFFQISTEP